MAVIHIVPLFSLRPLFPRRLRKWDPEKPAPISAATDAKVLTAGSVSRGARTACGGFGFACNTSATFYVFHWLQVTNLSFPKSTPNGVNYIDIRRFFLHARYRV